MPSRLRILGAVWLVLVLARACLGQSAADYAVRVSAIVQASPARIILFWPGDPKAAEYSVSRKTRDAISWGAPKLWPGSTTNYVDTGVSSGNAYEYRVIKTAPTGTSNYTAHGYIYAGINSPLVDNRGKILLIVESSVAPSLELPLNRLQTDLAGDGWTVLRRNISRTESDTSVKALILAEYRADPNGLKAVFLLGHLAVPYSGNYTPDGHTEHRGAWPADAFYADLDDQWTDNVVSNTAAGSLRTLNIPGDGKYDQTYIPTDVELQLGRVDLVDLPAFALSETELLSRYLEKNHHFRHRHTQAQGRGLIDDHFGAFHGEAFAANGWRAFAPMFGADETIAGDWMEALHSGSWLCGYGAGSGTYTSAGGVITTSQLAASDPQVVFAFLFGSYFGDWDSRDNLLRATLATPTYTLVSAWAGRPYWLLHHAALGETLGFCAKVTQNNWTLYSSNLMPSTVHIALMGDPTLRLHPVAPPGALTVAANVPGGADLQWTASPDPGILGYHVYRGATAAGPFTRLTSSLLAATSYRSSTRSGVFMVRAVKLQQTASGTYHNASQGIMENLDGSVGRTAIGFLGPVAERPYIVPTAIPLAASVHSAANSVTNVAFYGNDALLAEVSAPPYHVSWTNAPVGVFEVVARAYNADGSWTNAAPVTIQVDNGGAPSLTIVTNDEGGFTVRGTEAFRRTYIVEYSDDCLSTNWQVLTIVTNPAPGVFEAVDIEAAQRRFYRTRLPQ